MVAAANLVEIASLVGDTTRAMMLAALMDGRSLTATELAYCANVSRSTASAHLAKLVAARLVLDLADGKQLERDRFELDTTLVVRSSTAAPRVN